MSSGNLNIAARELPPSAILPAGFPLRVTLLLVASLTIMAGTVVAPALPAIREVFGDQANVDLLSRMVLTLPALFVAFCAPIAGAVADRFGRRNLLIASVLLYAIAGMSGLVAQSLTMLLVGRAALGLAIGAIMTVGTALVGDYFEGEERARFLGLQQAFTQLGGVVFVAGGGVLSDLHWRAPFAIYGLALLVLLAVFLFVQEPNRPRQQAASSTPVVWNWPLIFLLCVLAYLVNALFYTVPVQLAFFLRELGLPRPSTAGYAIGLFNLVAAITALNYGRLRGGLSAQGIFALSLGVMGIGFCLLSYATGWVPAFAALAIMGAGLGFTMPNLIASTIQVAAPAARGRVAGLLTSSMFLGHFTSPIASQPVVARLGYATTYLGVGFVFLAIAAVALVAFAINRRSR